MSRNSSWWKSSNSSSVLFVSAGVFSSPRSISENSRSSPRSTSAGSSFADGVSLVPSETRLSMSISGMSWSAASDRSACSSMDISLKSGMLRSSSLSIDIPLGCLPSRAGISSGITGMSPISSKLS
ncbi:MAG TPA: hypothetical protein PK986_02835 [Spirochaetota bacterium]|nr:hypothetical protein [Spirochaetota bacterium]